MTRQLRRSAAINLTFRVDLDPALTEAVTLSWAVTGGTATAVDSDVVLAITYAAGANNPADLGTLPTTATINQGQTSATAPS